MAIISVILSKITSLGYLVLKVCILFTTK